MSRPRETNPYWKGGRIRHSEGYVLIHYPEHPFATDGCYMAEHRLVVERHLREQDPESPYLVQVDGQLYLRRDVLVHHHNEVKDDNRLENLEPMTRAEHVRLHNPRKAKR